MLKQRNILEKSSFLWFFPMIGILILFYLYPMLDVIRLSFTNSTLLNPNYMYSSKAYKQIFEDPDIFYTFCITFIFVFVNVGLQLVLGLIIALAINYGTKRRMFSALITRTIVLSAWVIPGIVIGVIWKLLLSEGSYGIVNYFAKKIGIGEIPFLSLPNYALASVIVANIWRNTAFTMIIEYAGLQRIPEELYEVASIDGAGSIAKFVYITLPQLRSILFINLVLITIYTFNTFDIVLALTGGGPGKATELLALSIYNRIFRFMNLGRGASLAVILLIINLFMSLLYYQLLQLKTVEE